MIIKENPVNIIIGFNLSNSGFFSILLKREFNIPAMVCIRGDDIGLNIFDFNKFSALQWIINSSDTIVCVNDHLKRRLKITFPEVIGKTYIIPNSISIDDLVIIDKHACRVKLIKETTWNYNDIILVFIGHLREKKGIRIILESVKLLMEKLPIRLLVVGPLLEHFELFKYSDIVEYLVKHNLIHFTGFIPHNQTKEWLNSGDILLMPSLDDGLPNGLLEGMAANLCPIVSDIFDDIIINYQNGIVLRNNNVNELISAITELEGDRSLIKILGENAKRKLLEWTPNDEANRYMEILNQTLNKVR